MEGPNDDDCMHVMVNLLPFGMVTGPEVVYQRTLRSSELVVPRHSILAGRRQGATHDTAGLVVKAFRL